MKFSIITACLNSETTIEKTIQSVISQTYKNTEYIIVDGKSEDRTMAIIRRYQDKIAHVVSEADSGIFDAMNKGISLATGDIICFLNADDRFFYEKSIANIAARIDQFRPLNVDVFHGSVLIFDNQNGNGYIWKSGAVSRFSIFRGSIPHPATFYTRQAFQKNGLFDSSYKLAGDYEWTVRAVVKNNLKFKYLPILVAIFFKGGVSTNKIFDDRIKIEKQRAVTSHYRQTEYYYLRLRTRFRKIFGI